MTDPIIEQAQRAAETPADGPPHDRGNLESNRRDTLESNRILLTRHAIAQKPGSPEHASAMEALKANLAYQDGVAPPAVKVQSPGEDKIGEIRKRPEFWDKMRKDHAKTMAEFRAAVANADTPEERQRLVDADISDVRELYGFQVPKIIAAGGHEAVQDFEQNYQDHDRDFLLHARSEGWDKPLVNELREYGVKLAMDISGRSGSGMSAADVDEFKEHFRGKLTKGQADQLLTWFRKNVVGE